MQPILKTDEMTNRDSLSTRRSFLKLAGAGSLALMAPATSAITEQKPLRSRLNRDSGSLTSIGNTPLLKLHHLPDENGAEIWVKWEGANPTGSMKDRMALGMIEDKFTYLIYTI